MNLQYHHELAHLLGLPIGPDAQAESALASFETRNGVVLPASMREFYLNFGDTYAIMRGQTRHNPVRPTDLDVKRACWLTEYGRRYRGLRYPGDDHHYERVELIEGGPGYARILSSDQGTVTFFACINGDDDPVVLGLLSPPDLEAAFQLPFSTWLLKWVRNRIKEDRSPR